MKIIRLVLFLLSFSLALVHAGGQEVNEKLIEVKKLLAFNELSAEVNWDRIFLTRMELKVLAIDEEFMFILDIPNHRVLKFDLSGSFITQIGRIGQTDSTLFWPSAICIQNRMLYILDKGGQRVKIFDLSGNFKKAIEIPDAWMTSGFAVDEEGRLYLAVVFPKMSFAKRKLITVFDRDGKKINEIGEVIPAKDNSSFVILNHCQFQVRGDQVIGTFSSVPFIFGYSTGGEKLYSINLLEKHIAEIVALYNIGKKERMENHIKVEGLMRKVMYYNFGFAVVGKDKIYFATSEKTLLVLNPNGEVEERIRLLLNGKELRIWQLCFWKDQRLAVVGGKQEGYSLVSF